MTRDEAVELRVGKDKVFVVEPKMEEVFEMTVVRIELDSYKNLNSGIMITANGKPLGVRVYSPGEICDTMLKALEKLASIHQFRSDQALNKKFAVAERIAKLKRKSR